MDINASINSAKTTLTTKYAAFSGRAGPMEFWSFTLLALVVNILASVIFGMIGLGIVATIVTLALLVPSIAVTVRRLHDRDMVGWIALIGLVPVLGGLALLYLCYLPGTDGENKYGPKPVA